MVSWYLLGLICCSAGLPVLLTAAAMPDHYLCLCLQSVESTAFHSGGSAFPCLIPHPPVPIVPSVSCTLSVRCCPSLCLVDPAKQHPRAVGYTGDRNKQWSWWDCRAEKALYHCKSSGKDYYKEHIQQRETWLGSPHLRLWFFSHLVLLYLEWPSWAATQCTQHTTNSLLDQ